MDANVLPFLKEPPLHVMQAINNRDWLALLQCIDKGLPVNSAWKGVGTFFECFVVGASMKVVGFKDIQLQKMVVRKFIEKGLLDVPPFLGFRCSIPVTVCAYCNRLDLLKILVEEGRFSLEVGDENQLSPLHAMCIGMPSHPTKNQAYDVVRLQDCLTYIQVHSQGGEEEKGHWNAPLAKAMPPLMLAAKNNNKPMIKALIELGADPVLPEHQCLLNHAVKENDAELLAFLVKKGVALPTEKNAQDAVFFETIGKFAGPQVFKVLWKELGAWSSSLGVYLEEIVKNDELAVLVWCQERVHLSHFISSQKLSLLDVAVDHQSVKCLKFMSTNSHESTHISPYVVNSFTGENAMQRALKKYGLKYVKEQLGWTIPLSVVAS